ncbi:MAG TPA: glycerophosphodiester phosphodiesterase [Planctomycetota bacterium]|nr:glycerophosphodiester phosphodiesterase [Planctomycetota bacterium]
MTRPRIIAHRGASAAAPENTAAAFALAKRVGADAIELDARLCGSGEAVVFHDAALDRLAGAEGLVSATPLERLRELRVAGREPIPTLEEVLRSEERPPGIVIEIKTDRWSDLGAATEVAVVLEATRALDRGPVTISSFNPLILQKLRTLVPKVPRALLAHAKQPRPLRQAWAARLVAARELHLEARMIGPAVVAKAHRAGRAVVAWTVNEAGEAARLADLGVDGIITDVPETVLAAVEPRRG